jgi:hypothetical protein
MRIPGVNPEGGEGVKNEAQTQASPAQLVALVDLKNDRAWLFRKKFTDHAQQQY